MKQQTVGDNKAPEKKKLRVSRFFSFLHFFAMMNVLPQNESLSSKQKRTKKEIEFLSFSLFL